MKGFRATAPIGLVVLLSLLLLVFVGYGETLRVYSQLRLDRSASLAEIVREPIEIYAQTGLPLHDFSGFQGRARNAADVDPAIVSLSLRQANGASVFSLPGAVTVEAAFTPSRLHLTRPGLQLAESPTHFRISLPVAGKFGPVGEIVADVDRETVEAPVERAFALLLAGAVGLSLAMLAFVQLRARRDAVVPAGLSRTVFAAAFGVISVLVIATMFRLFSDGIEAKTRGLAESMAERLSSATELGVQLADLSGLAAVLAEYQAINPDIDAIAIIHGVENTLHTDPGKIGQPHELPDNAFEFAIPLRGAGLEGELRAAVTVPLSVVIERLWRSGKNFVALFVVCGLVALTFLAAGEGIAGRRGMAEQAGIAVEHELGVLKAAYFLGVFLDSLAISFLPSYASHAAEAAGLSGTWGALPFTVYFLTLTAALVPASRLAQSRSIRSLMLGGTVLTAGGFVLLAFGGFAELVAGRAISGAGQGALLIAAQSQALRLVPAHQRTRGAAVQVHSYNVGIIAGAAIGGLLAAFIDAHHVFILSALIGVAAVAYVAAFVHEVPRSESELEAGATAADGGVWRDLRAALGDGEFLRALAFIGIVSKFVLTGVVMFAAPLLLRRRGYEPEDVGQIVMFFGFATLAATAVGARIVDRVGSARATLALGGLASGTGMLLLAAATGAPGRGGEVPLASLAPLVERVAEVAALLAAAPVPFLTTLVAILGLSLIGVAQGLTAAPIVTFIGDTPAARRRGRLGVIGIYRLLERIGHVTGPVVVARALSAAGGSAAVVAVVGGAAALCGGLFLLASRRPARDAAVASEKARGP